MATDLSETPGTDSFSSDYLNPTPFTLTLGSNTLTGEVGAPGSGTLLADGTDGGTDGDYFTVVVPTGQVLDDIIVNRYNQLQRGFAIYAPGATFGAPVAQGPNVFYPFSDGALFVGSGDIVPLPPQPLFIGSGAPFDPSDGGFNVDSLAAGTYSFLIQENQFVTTDYVLDFVTIPVPEPSSLALVLLGGIGAFAWRGRNRLRTPFMCALLLACCSGQGAQAQTLVNDLGGALSDGGDISLSGQVTQIAFLPGDDTHAYVATFGGGVLRYDYDPTIANFLSNPTAAVPASISNQGGVNGSLGIAFHEDATLGTVMYIAPAVPFTGGGGLNDLHDQSIVRLNDSGGDGVFGNEVGELNQNIVNNVNVSQVHQINQLQVRGDSLYAAIGIRTQNGGQTSAQNQAIGGSGVDQSNPGETAYTGTVSFIEDLSLLSSDTTTTNISGFTIADITGDSTVDDLDVRADSQPFSSTDPSKLRVYATGFRNNYGVDIDDAGEMWVSYNQNENPNAEDELHRNVTFQSDHQFFKGNNIVGDWKVSGDEDGSLTQNSSQIALDAGYFNAANSVAPFKLLGFNTAAGGLDFFAPDTADASLRGDVLQSRNSGSGQDVLYVDEETGNSFVV
ncbi:MAG: PEP-CTERM sorting domain-containing protein, partial [Aeoliella sp.]